MKQVNIQELKYYFSEKLPAIAKGKLRKNLVRVHWGRGLNNFGDCLSPLILKHFGLTPVYSQQKDTDIVLAGTMLQSIPENYTGIILGTGGGDISYSWRFPHASILAVRGSLTLGKMIHPSKESVVFGDPGLIMSYVLPEKVPVKYKLGIVPHFVDFNHPYIQNWKKKFHDVLFINPLEDPEVVITKIKSCETIVSSSLHGLVIADSFGIPNSRFVIRDTMPTKDFDFKYDDYYSAFSGVNNTTELNGSETAAFLISTVRSGSPAILTVKNTLYHLLKDTCSNVCQTKFPK